MAQISNILVSLDIEGNSFEVGELALNGKKIYFRYKTDFIKKGLNLSPLKLPFTTAISSAEPDPFNGLYGVFNDSLPDGWGQLLLDRTLAAKGIDIYQLTPLDRLTYIGNNGMGALCYHPNFDLHEDKNYQFELDQVAQEMQTILKGDESEIIDELFNMGGSSGGARPKIFVKYNQLTSVIKQNQKEYEKGFEDWIIKFPSSSDHNEIALIEYVYHKMALKAGLEMSVCKLFSGQLRKILLWHKTFRPNER